MLPLGEFAFQFIKRAVECKYLVFITKDVLFEVKNILGVDEGTAWRRVFSPLANKSKIELVSYEKDVEQRAIVLAKKENIPKTDALLIEVAKENNLILVSRNFHFEGSKGIIQIFKPEELD